MSASKSRSTLRKQLSAIPEDESSEVGYFLRRNIMASHVPQQRPHKPSVLLAPRGSRTTSVRPRTTPIVEVPPPLPQVLRKGEKLLDGRNGTVHSGILQTYGIRGGKKQDAVKYAVKDVVNNAVNNAVKPKRASATSRQGRTK